MKNIADNLLRLHIFDASGLCSLADFAPGATVNIRYSNLRKSCRLQGEVVAPRPYLRLTVVIDRSGSSYTAATLVEALQLQSLHPGAVIMQRDDTHSPAYVLKGAVN